MAEIASFGNIVNSLLTLRQNYQEQLKSIPQYEAYLLVQSSTERAAGALHGSAGSPASIAAEVIDSLQFARSRFEQHLSSLPQYRTLLAIDKLIKEISVDLGVVKPISVSAAKLPEAAFGSAFAPAGESATPTIAAEAVAAVIPEELASSPQTSPDSSRRVSVDLDSRPLGADEISYLEASEVEADLPSDEEEDLREIAYRDVAKAAADLAHVEHTVGAAKPAPAIPPQPRMFDEDTGEAAA